MWHDEDDSIGRTHCLNMGCGGYEEGVILLFVYLKVVEEEEEMRWRGRRREGIICSW